MRIFGYSEHAFGGMILRGKERGPIAVVSGASIILSAATRCMLQSDAQRYKYQTSGNGALDKDVA